MASDPRVLPRHEIYEFSSRKSRYCVMIAVINEGKRIQRQLGQIQDLDLGLDVVIADGGSTDGSTSRLAMRLLGVRTLLVKDDAGHLGAQIRMGFSYCLNEGYAGIVTIDGNGKDGLEAISAFAAALDNGADFVQGSRFLPGGTEENTPWVRRVAIRCIHAPIVSLVAGFHFTDTTNGFRAYSSRYLLHPGLLPFRGIFQDYEILAYLSVRAPQLGLETREIPVARSYPLSAATPTKISPIRGNASLIRALCQLMLRRFNP